MITSSLANIMGQQGILVLVILLLLFGAKKLPELAKGLGQAIREFSKAKNDIQDEIMRETPVEPARQIPPQHMADAPRPAAHTEPVETAKTSETAKETTA